MSIGGISKLLRDNGLDEHPMNRRHQCWIKSGLIARKLRFPENYLTSLGWRLLSAIGCRLGQIDLLFAVSSRLPKVKWVSWRSEFVGELDCIFNESTERRRCFIPSLTSLTCLLYHVCERLAMTVPRRCDTIPVEHTGRFRSTNSKCSKRSARPTTALTRVARQTKPEPFAVKKRVESAVT